MERAKVWLERYARPLEMARWNLFFGEGSADDVIRYLSAFQNGDGGFGHGLEPDFWLPQSSPMASWMAAQILLEIGATPNNEVVRKLLTYLMETTQVQPGMWQSVLPDTNFHPHAPWWHWHEDVQQSWMFNPSVELAACLIFWSTPGSAEANLGWISLEYAVRRLMNATTVERHELSNYRNALSLLSGQQESFVENVKYSMGEVSQKVQQFTIDVIDKDVDNWDQGYKPLPLDFIKSTHDPLHLKLEPLVKQNLKFYLDTRNDDGIWEISWNWEQYPEDFAIARRYWQGIVAVERYRILATFNSM